MEAYRSSNLWAKSYLAQAEQYAATRDKDSYLKLATRASFSAGAVVGCAEAVAKIAPALILFVGAIVCKATSLIFGDFALGTKTMAAFKAYRNAVIGSMVATALALASVVNTSLSKRIGGNASAGAVISLRELASRNWEEYKGHVLKALLQGADSNLNLRIKNNPLSDIYLLRQDDKVVRYCDPMIHEAVAKLQTKLKSIDPAINAAGISSEERERRIAEGIARVHVCAQKFISKIENAPLTYLEAIKYKLDQMQRLQKKGVRFMDEQFQRIGAAKRLQEPAFDEKAFTQGYAEYRARQLRAFDVEYSRLADKAKAFNTLWENHVGAVETQMTAGSRKAVELLNSEATMVSELAEGLAPTLLGAHLPPTSISKQILNELKGIYAVVKPQVDELVEAQKQQATQVAKNGGLESDDVVKGRAAYEGIMAKASSLANDNVKIAALLKMSTMDHVISEIQWFLNPPEKDAGSPFTTQQKTTFKKVGQQLVPQLGALTKLRAGLERELSKGSFARDAVEQQLRAYEVQLRQLMSAAMRHLDEENGQLFLSAVTRSVVVSEAGAAASDASALTYPVINDAAGFARVLNSALNNLKPSVSLFNFYQNQWMYRLSGKDDQSITKLADRGLDRIKIVQGHMSAGLDKLTATAAELTAIKQSWPKLMQMRQGKASMLGHGRAFSDFNWQIIKCENHFKGVVTGAVKAIEHNGLNGWFAGVSRWLDDRIGYGWGRPLKAEG